MVGLQKFLLCPGTLYWYLIALVISFLLSLKWPHSMNIASSQAIFQKSAGESMLLIATWYTSLNLQDNIADIAVLN
jgi:hypothetical protein